MRLGQVKERNIQDKRDASYAAQRRKTLFSRLLKAVFNLITCIPLLIFIVIHLGWEDNKTIWQEIK